MPGTEVVTFKVPPALKVLAVFRLKPLLNDASRSTRPLKVPTAATGNGEMCMSTTTLWLVTPLVAMRVTLNGSPAGKARVTLEATVGLP